MCTDTFEVRHTRRAMPRSFKHMVLTTYAQFHILDLPMFYHSNTTMQSVLHFLFLFFLAIVTIVRLDSQNFKN